MSIAAPDGHYDVYALAGFVSYIRLLESGHYKAFFKSNNEWILADDSMVINFIHTVL